MVTVDDYYRQNSYYRWSVNLAWRISRALAGDPEYAAGSPRDKLREPRTTDHDDLTDVLPRAPNCHLGDGRDRRVETLELA
jgi:hypothetical protein